LQMPNTIILERPDSTLNIDLIDALKNRKSTMQFLTKEITLKELSTVLWYMKGADTIEKNHVVPWSNGYDFMNIYVLSNSGIYKYDDKNHILRPISPLNIKSETATATGGEGIKEASNILLLAANMSKLDSIRDPEIRLKFAHSTAGALGQNAYLVANSMKLGIRFLGSLNKGIAPKYFQLGRDEILLYSILLGYKKL
jgi:nitroreductase